MPALKAGTGIPFTVTDGRDTLSFSNVAAGEVWLCSGQSNMAFELKGADTFSKEGLDDPMLRFYDMKSHLKPGGWSGAKRMRGRLHRESITTGHGGTARQRRLPGNFQQWDITSAKCSGIV